MIGKLIAAATGAAINKEQHGNPVTGAAVGFATMAVARRFLPARFAALGATLAAGYLTKKLADRAERRAQAEKAVRRAPRAGVADSFALIEENTPNKAATPRKTPAARPKVKAAPRTPRVRAAQSARAIKVPETTG